MFKSYFWEIPDEDYYGPRTEYERMASIQTQSCGRLGCRRHTWTITLEEVRSAMGRKNPRMGTVQQFRNEEGPAA